MCKFMTWIYSSVLFTWGSWSSADRNVGHLYTHETTASDDFENNFLNTYL